MSKLNDLTGQKFGRLTVIEQAETINHRVRWKCRCDCGNECIVNKSSLLSGGTKSCGCLHKEIVAELGRKNKGNKKHNNYDMTGKYGKCFLTDDKKTWFIFDKEDYDKIYNYTWRKDNRGYVRAYIRKNHRDAMVFVHSIIMNTPNNKVVDHINHNLLDNRKHNLRLVTTSQNAMNQKIKSNNTSGVMGVDYDIHNNHWRARICVNGKRILLGVFSVFEDAVKARKEAEEKYFGEHSYNNSMKVKE